MCLVEQVLNSRPFTTTIYNPKDLKATTMCLVEQFLNSRPFTTTSYNPKDLEALSPNPFLGRSSDASLLIPNAPNNNGMRNFHQKSQSYIEMIWTRWRGEYPPDWEKKVNWARERETFELENLSDWWTNP